MASLHARAAPAATGLLPHTFGLYLQGRVRICFQSVGKGVGRNRGGGGEVFACVLQRCQLPAERVFLTNVVK